VSRVKPARNYIFGCAGYHIVKSRLWWGADLHTGYNPYEAGLGWAVRLDKGDFLGREALRRIKEEGVGRRLCCLTFPSVDDIALGCVTSANYGYSVGKYIAYGYMVICRWSMPPRGPKSRSNTSACGIRQSSAPSRSTTRPWRSSKRKSIRGSRRWRPDTLTARRLAPRCQASLAASGRSFDTREAITITLSLLGKRRIRQREIVAHSTPGRAA
jgi:hypothetical protein